MFYKTGIDISSPKSMWNFLHDHFTYYTMNSWNGLRTIAHNVKLYNLNLDGDWSTVLRFLEDGADCGDLHWQIQSKIDDFATDHLGYRVYSNGRSGGYLILCSVDNNRTVLPDCVDQYDTYEDFKADCRVYGESVMDYIYELRQVTEVVRAFDKLCDELRDLVNEYSKMNYEVQALAYNIDRFNEEYSSDLELLGFKELEVNDDGKVNVQEVQTLNCLMETLLHYFASLPMSVGVEDGFLYAEV